MRLRGGAVAGIASLVVALGALAAAPALCAEREPSPAGVAVGESDPCALGGRSDDEPLAALVTVHPEREGGADAFGAAAACARGRHLQLDVRLAPPSDWQRAADPYGALKPWLDALDRFFQRHVASIHVVELGERPDETFEPRAYAYLVEKVSTMLRSLDPRVRLVVGALSPAHAPWLREIPPSRLDPYVTGFALSDPVDLEATRASLAADYPAAALWLHAAAGATAEAFLARMASASAAGVKIVWAESGGAGARMAGALALALPSRFVADAHPAAMSADGVAGAGLLGALLDPLGPERGLLLAPPPAAAREEPLQIVIGVGGIRQARAFDLSLGRELIVPGLRPGDRGGETRLTIEPTPGPILVRYLADEPARGALESVGVTAQGEMSAAEIVARMRAVEAAQGRRLRSYMARATLSFHYRAEALQEAFDYASVNRFYWRDGVGEYEETDLFINGARWRGTPPSLPFVQPEMVKEVPLDIRLDASYAYRLEGHERLAGAPCYVVSFEPVGTAPSLYSGSVWVDETSFARRRIRLVQHGLKEPITSTSDEIDYAPVGGEGGESWLPKNGYRQMVLTVLGHSVVVERRAAYEEIRVNPDGFDQARADAFASSHPIVRDDAGGMAVLRKQPDGSRTAQRESLENTAIFGGIGFDPRPHIGVPFVGLNYFNFDWRGTGTQLDVAFAGILLDTVWTDPRFLGSHWELSLEGRFIGISAASRRPTDSGFQGREDLKIFEQVGFLTLAHPLTTFSRIELQTELSWDAYLRSKHTDGAMVLPADGFTLTEAARWKYSRAGYILSLWASESARSRWADWGLPPGASGVPGDRGVAGDDRFMKWGLDAIKAYYPTRLQKVSLGVSAQAGSALDRFSRFEIGEFGRVGAIRIRGYNGAGITFDRGVTGKVTYQFTLAGNVSVELGVEGAVLENQEDFTTRSAGDRETIAGGGFGVSFNGPWGTLVSVRSGWALQSSLPIHGSSASSRLVLIKTFGRWPFRRQAAPDPAAAATP
ncbi:MAG: hypothetical protein HY049_05615 [Acidobacteria bacterium]|nr:hypothetical protein [Acidobacteriota bacterium]